MNMTMTKEAVMLAVFGGAKSLSEVFHSLGGKGNVSGSTTKKMREMVPNIQAMFDFTKDGNFPSKDSIIGQTLKAICPDIYAEHFPTVAKVAKVAKVKAEKSPSLKGKDRIVMTYQKTGNPFKVNSLNHIAFHHFSKGFRVYTEVKDEIANDPLFIEACGADMSLEDRMKRVDWQRDMMKAGHQNSKGATDIIKDETGKMVKAVCLV